MAAISIGVAMVAGSGSSTGLKSELRTCSAFEQHVLSFKKQTIERQKTQSLLLLQPYYRFNAQLKVAKVRPKQAQLVCAAHGTREPCLDGAAKLRRYCRFSNATVLTLN